MKVLLFASESPVRERLADAISEVSGIQVEIQEPCDAGADRMSAQLLPDVVLVDIDHTRGRGIEIIKGIRGRRGGRMPIIMAIASSPSFQYRASCHEAGAMYFFNRGREQDWLIDSLASIRDQLG